MNRISKSLTLVIVSAILYVFAFSSFIFGAEPEYKPKIEYAESNESVTVTVSSNANLKNVCYMWNYRSDSEEPVFVELDEDMTEITFTAEKPRGDLTELVVIANNHIDVQLMIIPVTAFIDNDPPAISVVNANLQPGESPTVLIEDSGKLKFAMYRLSGQSTYSLTASSIYEQTQAELNLGVPLTIPGRYRLSMIVFDLAGNMTMKTFYIYVNDPDAAP